MTQTNFTASLEDLTNFLTKEIEKNTISTGKTLEKIAENPFLRSVNKVISLDWIMSFLGQADLAKVQANVTQIKNQYPYETANQIAHRLIVQKAWKGGQLGLITNIIPPIAVFFLGIEVIATTKLQTEMVYEIAAAYGLNLNEPARRGEALAIFGLSLGADALKTGLSIVEIIPGIGAVVGASANAAMLYVLGQTACRFYERKANNLTTTSIESIERESDRDWQTTLNQSRILDQVLAQMVKISYRDRDWQEILPTIREISPSSVETIALDWDRPQTLSTNLSTLLEQLLPEFAPLALNRCYEIAKSKGGEITLAEQEVLSQIAIKFNLDLSALGS
jgi:uncharacterized protein (DUF697 family)